MMVKVKNGKIKLPKKVIEKYGEKLRLIDGKDRIILLPVSDDPLKELREEWKDVDESVEELKENALKEALEEATR